MQGLWYHPVSAEPSMPTCLSCTTNPACPRAGFVVQPRLCLSLVGRRCRTQPIARQAEQGLNQSLALVLAHASVPIWTTKTATDRILSDHRGAHTCPRCCLSVIVSRQHMNDWRSCSSGFDIATSPRGGSASSFARLHGFTFSLSPPNDLLPIADYSSGATRSFLPHLLLHAAGAQPTALSQPRQLRPAEPGMNAPSDHPADPTFKT